MGAGRGGDARARSACCSNNVGRIQRVSLTLEPSSAHPLPIQPWAARAQIAGLTSLPPCNLLPTKCSEENGSLCHVGRVCPTGPKVVCFDGTRHVRAQSPKCCKPCTVMLQGTLIPVRSQSRVVQVVQRTSWATVYSGPGPSPLLSSVSNPASALRRSRPHALWQGLAAGPLCRGPHPADQGVLYHRHSQSFLKSQLPPGAPQ